MTNSSPPSAIPRMIPKGPPAATKAKRRDRSWVGIHRAEIKVLFLKIPYNKVDFKKEGIRYKI